MSKDLQSASNCRRLQVFLCLASAWPVLVSAAGLVRQRIMFICQLSSFMPQGTP